MECMLYFTSVKYALEFKNKLHVIMLNQDTRCNEKGCASYEQSKHALIW